MKNYQYLNLEQKMLRIRRKMPTLLKDFTMMRLIMILLRWMIFMKP